MKILHQIFNFSSPLIFSNIHNDRAIERVGYHAGTSRTSRNTAADLVPFPKPVPFLFLPLILVLIHSSPFRNRGASWTAVVLYRFPTFHSTRRLPMWPQHPINTL